jgi:nucleoid-associated protein YgaU
MVYGDIKLWREIYQANRDVMRNPNSLEPGMQLVIPAL